MEDELYHFGVKGMKWGVRKKRQESFNKKYTRYSQIQDRTMYGHAGTKRINRSMNKGMTHKQAVEREKKRRNVMRLANYGAAMLLADPRTRGLLNQGLSKAANAYAHSPVYMNYLKLRYGRGYNWSSPAKEALKEIGNKVIVDTTLA